MEFRPILSAMRRNKVGAILISLQMAITLAILCNGIFIIVQRVALSKRPTGADESNIFVIPNQWVGSPPDLVARLRGDLTALRGLPGVIDAYATNSTLLSNSGSSEGVNLKPDQKEASAQTALYFADEHALNALGLKLVSGRNFNADEVTDKMGYTDHGPAGVVIITRALAEKLFPGKTALGQSIYVQPADHAMQVVGVVERMQVPWVGSWSANFNDNSILEPFRYADTYAYYVVRSQPNQLAGVLKAAEKKLYEVGHDRVLEKIKSLTEARAEVYQDDRGLAVILGVVCTALVAVMAFGIVGLTSYWVAQRRRQIGIRRALGATRSAILRYFQTENCLIAASGAALGIGLAVCLNLWMVSTFEMERLHLGYPISGALVMLLLGQASVLWPAMKAASVPPALATRAS
jgi:putative ABC transport system permease protein